MIQSGACLDSAEPGKIANLALRAPRYSARCLRAPLALTAGTRGSAQRRRLRRLCLGSELAEQA